MTESSSDIKKAAKKPVIYNYKPLAKLSTSVNVGFGLLIFMSVISILCVVAVRSLGLFAPGEAADALISTVAICDGLHMPVYLLSGVLLMIWMRRGYRNVSTFNNVEMSHGEWLCIWGWILPVVSLYIPASIVGEIWKASDPQVIDETKWKLKRDSKLVVSWWVCFISEKIVNLGPVFISERNYSSPELIAIVNGVPMFVFSKVLFISACVLLVMVVRDVTARQERKQALLAYAPPKADDVSR